MASFPTKSTVFSLLAVLLIIAGCDCGKKERIVKEGETPNLGVRGQSPNSVNEALHVLFVDASQVQAIQGSLALRFYVDKEFDLVVMGWDGNFDKNPPTFTPTKSARSSAIVKEGNYLGNLYIDSAALTQIKLKLGNGPGQFPFLKLRPFIDNRNGSIGQITYKLFYAKNRPRLYSGISLDSLMLIYDSVAAGAAPPDEEDARITLNPSPPRKETDQ